MAYLLPRAVIVLLGWGATYFILTALSTQLSPAVIYITGIAWVLAGIVCFGYLYKLRREMGFPHHRPIAAPLPPTTRKPAASLPTILARLRALPPRRRTAA
jgi:hypothetical protein